MKAGEFAPGVEFAAGVGGDHYQGKPETLIAAGIITFDQLPTKASQTFYDGERVDGRRCKAAHDERWMQVTYRGRALAVVKGISAEERARRIAARNQELEELARTAPDPDPGWSGIGALRYKASATFAPGEEVIAKGHPATVVEGFRLHKVDAEKGAFTDGRTRFDYMPGYTCRRHSDNKVFFYPTHMVRTRTGARGYLRSIASTAPAAEWPFATVYGSAPQ